MTDEEKGIHLDELKRVHNTLLDLISDLKYLNEINYWGDGDYVEVKNHFDRALTVINIKIEKEVGK